MAEYKSVVVSAGSGGFGGGETVRRKICREIPQIREQSGDNGNAEMHFRTFRTLQSPLYRQHSRLHLHRFDSRHVGHPLS